MSGDHEERSESRWTRRRFVRVGVGVAAFAAGAAATGTGAVVVSRLLPSPVVPGGEVLDDLVYTRFPTDQWWNVKANTPVRAGDFALWQGATAVWRGLFHNGEPVPGTGYPVLVVRVPRVDSYYRIPSDPAYPVLRGYALFYDDPARDLRIVAGFDRCTHLCCYPGWHVVQNPPPGRDYPVPPPTYAVYNEDPVYCICHGTQYDPLLLIEDWNPKSQVPFPGMQLVHGPGTFAMPLIPLRVTDDDVLQGGMSDPRWYVYC